MVDSFEFYFQFISKAIYVMKYNYLNDLKQKNPSLILFY